MIRFRRKKEHLRFSEEIKLVPRGLVAAMLVLLAVAEIITLQLCYHNFPDGEVWPPVQEFGRNAGMTAVAGIVLAVWIPLALIVFLLGYVYWDAKRRGMNAVMWLFLVCMMLPAWVALGFILYFSVREPLPYHCPKCGAMVSARFNYCPGCKCGLHPACEHCQSEVGDMDKYCPNCGNDLVLARNGETPGAGRVSVG